MTIILNYIVKFYIVKFYHNNNIIGNKQLAKYAGMAKKSLPHLKAIVVWDEKELDASMVAKCSVPVYLW